MPRPHKHEAQSYAAFTLLELLLSIAILAIITAIAATVNTVALNSADKLAAQQTVKQTLRLAQVRAQGMLHDTRWGVNFTSGQLVLFSGGSFASRNTARDEVFPLPGGVSLSGLSEVVFTKVAGQTGNTGDIYISTPDGSQTITVNQYGVLNE